MGLHLGANQLPKGHKDYICCRYVFFFLLSFVFTILFFCCRVGQFVCYEHKPLGRSLHTHPSAHVYSRSQSHLLFLLLPSASYHHTLPHEAQFQHHCHALKKVLLNTYLPLPEFLPETAASQGARCGFMLADIRCSTSAFSQCLTQVA